MPGPSTPSTSKHEHHDVLLVAQFAAADSLQPKQLAEAQRLVSECPACATLVHDLGIVSAAVAQEPVPPRRRDYRLSAEQAEHLSGNALTRFLRGFPLPSSRAFQPVAAGALSLGLAFLVVGYAWPEDGVVSVQAEPNYATYEQPTAAAPAAEPAAELVPSSAPEGLADDALAAAAEERFSADPEFFEDLAEHQAGSSMRSNQKSIASEAELPAADADRSEAEGIVGELAAPEAAAAAPAEEGPAVAEAVEADVAADGTVGEVTVGDGAAEATDDTSAAEQAPAAEPPVTTQAAAPEVQATPTTDEEDLTDLLIVVGLVLALGGGGLLLLSWLVRRSRDPLLR